ncbi:MAG: thioredoxin-disulfide reductase [Clostridia bacterium]
MYDLMILGAGPAGLTAAIYASRAGLKTLVLEKMFSGGLMTTTPEVENYPGFMSVSGTELSMKMDEHARSTGAEFKSETAKNLERREKTYEITTDSGTYSARAVIAALGSVRRKLGISGEERLAGSGVSYCATCDGGFFRGRDVCVIGGGNTALEDALYLSGICKKVYLIHRRSEFRGFKGFSDAVYAKENIELVLDSVPINISGERTVENVIAKNVKTNAMREIPVAGVFVAVGAVPDTELLRGIVRLDEAGYVIAGEDTHTSAHGLFAAGDLRKKPMYQIITACADGAVAAHEAGAFLNEGQG